MSWLPSSVNNFISWLEPKTPMDREVYSYYRYGCVRLLTVASTLLVFKKASTTSHVAICAIASAVSVFIITYKSASYANNLVRDDREKVRVFHECMNVSLLSSDLTMITLLACSCIF